VLGGAGFLGSALLEGLVGICPNLFSGDIRPSPIPHIQNIKIDMLDRELLNDALENFDLVVNLVGQIADPFYLTLDLNTTGMFNLAEAVRRAGATLVHISSVSVYGSADSCDETSPLNPETSYATAKASAERILMNGVDPLDLTILRLSNLYGYGQVKGVVAYLMRSFLGDQQLYFNNAGDLIRNYLHTEDCVGVIREFIQSRERYGVYNIVGQDQYSISELVCLAESIYAIEYETHFTQVAAWENIGSLSGEKMKKLQQGSYKWDLSKYLSERGNNHE
jgi:nucleoside-diphosphate-sugar epimerase